VPHLKLLVIGGGGQLGRRIIQQAPADFEPYATYITRRPPLEDANAIQLDKTNREEVQLVFRKLRPEVVIDTAALHNVDYCETHQNEALSINAEGTRNVAEAASQNKARLVFISTDFVFDGSKGSYLEIDKPNPINYYGVTKVEGERIISETCHDYAIVRPSVIYSCVSQDETVSSSGKPLNFGMWLVQKLKRREPVKIVSDQYASPTLADNLAEAVVKLAESRKNGIYHTAGSTRLSRYEFALKLADKLGFDRTLVGSTTTSELGQVAKRPPDSSLSIEKIEKELNVRMLPIDEALEYFRKQFREAQS
jgi:dTDP-4-dehydrorhamnose reductase